jgi:hypothetical protein
MRRVGDGDERERPVERVHDLLKMPVLGEEPLRPKSPPRWKPPVRQVARKFVALYIRTC